MIYLLVGKDSFTKYEFIEQLKAKGASQVVDLYDDQDNDRFFGALGNKSLFEGTKLIRIFGVVEKIDFEKIVDSLKSSTDQILFIEEKLDKRKSETKKILANKNLVVREFDIPTGAAMVNWLDKRIQKYQLKFGKGASAAFSQTLGIGAGEFGETLYDLWQVDLELQKLQTFSEGKEITISDVKALTTENVAEDIFAITNAIADKDKKRTLLCLNNYIDRFPGSDEKSKIIGLSAIVAEQFRGILLVQGLMNRQQSDTEISKLTGYSSGRLFIYKKIAKNFLPAKIHDLLTKLELLDADMKTSSFPSALPFFMIINSILA